MPTARTSTSRMRASSACSSLASGVVSELVTGLVADAALGRGGEPGDDAELAEDAVQQVDDARLAVRAGDREERRGVLGGAVDPRGDLAEAARASGVTRTGRPASGGELGAGGIGEHRDRAVRGGLRRVIGAVRVAPGHADVEVAAPDRARGDADARHLEVVDLAAHLESNASARPWSDRGSMLRPECRGRRSGHEPNFLTRWLATRAPGRRMERSDTSSAPGSSPVGRRERMRRTSSS